MKLRNSILAVILVLTSFSMSAQSDSVKIVKLVDEMSNESYIIASGALLVVSESNTSGFSIKMSFTESKGKIVQDGLICKVIGIGSCVENNKMIIMFTDSTKITITSWNKFNCEGNAWFNLTDDEADQLSKKQVLKIKMENGRSFESLTRNIQDNCNDYFINLLAQAAENKYTVKKE